LTYIGDPVSRHTRGLLYGIHMLVRYSVCQKGHHKAVYDDLLKTCVLTKAMYYTLHLQSPSVDIFISQKYSTQNVFMRTDLNS
jgi:L-rhamnose mutarotase